eukprot:XP_015581773.1 uncharacterized protein LOC8267715 isoform X3 [Ricinus communis]
MEYDDNDFQSQNLHLAGEGSNKFSPVLRPYALPKFDFDDSLHGSLRFDSLVETEVFLGIESNENSQWIEDYSRGSSGIQFSSSAAESCAISRRNNVWSEATSSESVEMLLKSVGQEELIPAQTNTKESNACDELGCIIKPMEPSLKQESNTPARVGDVANLQSTLLPGEFPENFSMLDESGGEQQAQLEDSLLTHKGDVSVDQSLSDLSAVNVEVRLPISGLIDGKSDDVNQREVNITNSESLDTRMQEGSGSGAQVDSAVTTAQSITTGNDVLNNEDASNHVNKNADENLDVPEIDNGESQEQGGVSGQEGQRHPQFLHAEMVESGGSHIDDLLCMASVESMEESSTIETNLSSMEEPSIIPKGDSSLEVHDQSEVVAREVSVVVVEGNSTVERHEIEYSNLDNKDIVSQFGASLLSTDDNKASQDKVDGSCSSYGAIGSCLPKVSSIEFVSDIHAERLTSSSNSFGSAQTCEKNVVARQGDIDKVVPVEGTELPSDGSNMNVIVDKGVETSSYGEDSTGKEFVLKSQSDCTAINESDGVLVPSGNSINTDTVEHKDVEVLPLPAAVAFSDKEEELAAQISAEASFGNCETVSQVTTGVQSVSAVDTCNTESQIEPQGVALEEDRDCTKDEEAFPALCASAANRGDSTEAVIKENDEKDPINVSVRTINIEMHGPEPSAMLELCKDTSVIGQEEPAVPISGGSCFDQIAVPSTDGGQGTNTDLDKRGSGTTAVIRNTELSHDESDKQMKRSSDHSVLVSEAPDGDANKMQSASEDRNHNDASKDESSFTFEVIPLADLPRKDANNWQTFSTVEVSKASLNVDGSTSNSGLGHLDPKISQDPSHGSPKISDVATPRSGSKGNSERKPRRGSGKATAKESVKKGKPIKETASIRIERGEKTTNVSMSPSGVSQLLQSNDMQRYGHIDSSSVKQFVLATSSSGLPDLNSSVSQAAMFQQPFTDLQQVQLRAQIFVYGALISQGTAPDEAYMISAFGGLDGGRSIWENAWRSCIERLHGQKSHLVAPETPVQSRSVARAPEQSMKQSASHSKVVPSPVARGGKGTPPILNPIVPFSSPLWSVPTPSADTLQSSGIPRGPIMDYQRALSPLPPHQPPAPAVRNFVGHSPSWFSQAPFGGPWVASPPTSALDTSGRFSVQLPITEPIQLIPPKESSVSHSSGAKPTISVAQSTASAGAFPVPFLPDVKMLTPSAGQPSADSKPRKRKKASANENPGQLSLPPQHQMEPPPTSPVASSVSASAAVITPVGFVSKAPTEKFITSVTPTSSTDLRKGDQNAESGAVLSGESLSKVKEARVQAEVATAYASSAVTHSQEIWDQLDKQRNSGLLPDVEVKLASAAVSIAAAAAVAKAAAAAAKVASDAALQAKLMAEEALASVGQSNLCQSNVISFSEGMKSLSKATPASILKGDDGTNSSSSILVAAREAARRRVEAASAASKRAENMDAIVKAAELAAEAVSQAGKIVAMGDPLPLSELVAAGPEGYWKVAQGASELASKLNNVSREIMNVDNGADTFARQLKEVPSVKKGENQITSQGKLPISRTISSEDHDRLVDGVSGSSAATTKDKGQKGRKASDLTKSIEVVPESQNGSRSSIVRSEFEKAGASKESSIKEDSNVEVFKDGNGFKAAWFSAKVLSLKDGKAYVNYTELTSGQGLEKLKEWVPLEGEGDEAPKIRIARPITIMPFEGTRKRRRAAMGEHTWSVGDRVDAWIQDSWWEGVVTEKSKKDESVSVSFPGQGEVVAVSKWNIRPSLIWKDGEWIEWSNSGQKNRSSHEGDTPQEKRPRVRSSLVEAKGKDKASKTIDATESDKSDDPTLLALSGDEKLFNVGKSSKDGNRTDALRMTRTGLQKEGSRVIFGVPKPGKKRKFMEVSKHYVADRSSQNNEANDSVKFTKYLMPQGAGSRGWKSTSKTELNEKRPAISKPKVLKSGKPQNISGRTIPQRENLTSTSVSITDGSALTDHVAKTKDSVSHSENATEKQNLMGFQSFSTSGATEGPILFSALALPSDNFSSKKMPLPNSKPERVSKGKLAPAGGKFGKIEEDKALNGNSAKSTFDPVEPRRSNRRIQPTSRLLEGLQSSLMVSKIPSVSHDKSHKNRNVSRGNHHG